MHKPILDERQRELVTHILAVIDKPAHWTRNAYARRGDGLSTYAVDVQARRWCMAGAIKKVVSRSRIGDWDKLQREMDDLYPQLCQAINLASEGEFATIVELNDGCKNLAELRRIVMEAMEVSVDIPLYESGPFDVLVFALDEDNDVPF